MPAPHPDLSDAVWRKSSRSSGSGQDCVEVATLPWRKSSRSSGSGQNCVEVAAYRPGVVAVRDSKDPNGPALVVSPAQWHALLTGVRSGHLNLIA